MTQRGLTCRELIDFIAAYLDAELAPEQRETFEHHLSLCPHCVQYLESYRQTLRLGKQACADDDPGQADVPEELVAAILAARTRS
jgi:anti-sigma factor RsiW